MKRFLVGKRISLHGLTLEHLRPEGRYYAWLDDLGLDLHGERSAFPNSVERMVSYYDSAMKNHDPILLGIFDNSSEHHIGNITLQQIDWLHRRAYLGYLIGERDFTGKGIASEASLMILYYGFNKLNLDRVWTTVSSEHAASLRVAEKAGLKNEGCLRGHQLRKGVRQDMRVFGALREEWMRDHGGRALAAFAEAPI